MEKNIILIKNNTIIKYLNAQIEFTLLAEAREYRETIYLSNTPLDTSLETTNEKEFPKSLLSK